MSNNLQFMRLLLDWTGFFKETYMTVDIDIASLEAKIERVAVFCEELRAENHALHQRLADLEREKEALASRMSVARERIETIMDRLPAE
jgi:uncharacterized protein (TIGR02449 family)